MRVGRRTYPSPEQVRRLAARFALSEAILDRPISALSGGERMLLSLAKAKALSSQAESICLCSPFFWLDARNRHVVASVVLRWIKQNRTLDVNASECLRAYHRPRRLLQRAVRPRDFIHSRLGRLQLR
jgi:ABC-type iron transport system FetAB ATPase subunit